MLNEKVLGPFTEDEIKSQVADGRLAPDCLVWGRPQNVWSPVSHWLKDLPQLTATLEKKVSQQAWHFAVDGVSKGPLLRADLVKEIKNLHSKSEILVWTKGMKAWADLFEFHDLLDEIGINRREHPRAHIKGSVIIKYNDQTLLGQLRSLSPGGFGANQINAQLSMGQAITVEIRSESLGEPLVAKATVQYLTDTGFVGCKFASVNMEAKARILDYIRAAKSDAAQAA